MQNHTKGIIYVGITAFLWGFLGIALKVAVREVDPVTVVWFRFAIAFIVLAGWLAVKKPSSFKIIGRPPLLLILAALALSWNYMGYMLGVHYTTPSNANLIIQSGPLLLAIAGFVLFKEPLHKKQIIGFAVAIVGFVFFYRDQLAAFFEAKGSYKTGILFTFSSAAAWATYAILQKKLVAKHPVNSLNLVLFGLPAILYIPFLNLTPLVHLHWTWWLLLFFLGMNTLVAYTFLAKALQYVEANKVSIILIMNPMITFVTMGILTKMDVSWVQHERFTPVTIFGALILLTGAILVVKQPKKSRK